MLTVQMKEANENQHLLADIEVPVQRIDQGYTIGRTIANGAGLLACGVIAALFRDLNTLKIVGPLGGLCLLNMLGDGSEAWRKRVRKIPSNQLQEAVGAVGVKQCLALMVK